MAEMLLYANRSTCSGIKLKTQNSENDLFNPSITFYISLKKKKKKINRVGLGRHLLRQNIFASIYGTRGSFKQNLHVRLEN